MAWPPKDYRCVCPICDKEYVVHTEFLSGDTDAKGRVIAQCGKHSREEVRANYERMRNE